jgi:putative oxidoreductase
MDLALLVLRVVIGLLIVSHGAMKLFGAFGGPGLDATSGGLHSAGFRPARLWALMGSAAELIGGVLFVLGLLSPLGSVAIVAAMLIAVTKIHWPKVWVTQGGFEYALVMLTIALAVGIAGPGALSLDAWLGISVPPAVSLVVIILAALGYLVGMVTSAAKPTSSSPKAEEQHAA